VAFLSYMRGLMLVGLVAAPLACREAAAAVSSYEPVVLASQYETLEWLPPPDKVVYGPVPAPPACPPGMEHIGRYCIDRYEAHLVVPNGDGTYKLHPHHLRPPEGVAFEARSAEGAFPQGYISRVESAAACKRAGKRLCTWSEWRRGCQGPKWMRYPYGPTVKRGACNQTKTHLLQAFFGADPNVWEYEKHFNSPRLNQEPGYLAKSGEYKTCTGPEGLYDMVGNLHEWVSTMVTEKFVEDMEAEEVPRLKQPWHVGNGMFMGGFFSTDGQHGPGCYYTTIAHEPRYHDYSTGFRCCADALRDKNKPKKPQNKAQPKAQPKKAQPKKQ
jgi:sulfatase modifying factor 1